MRYIAPILVGLFLVAGASPAAAKMNFSCNVNTLTCGCAGPLKGADCQAMKKNCKAGGAITCTTLPSGNTYCTCGMAALTVSPGGAKSVKKGVGGKATTGTQKAQ